MRVLLTRRREDSERSAKRYHEAGFEPVILPLFERRATGLPMPGDRFDFTIFTSVAAVEALSPESHGSLRHLPAYAIGPRTAKVLGEKSYSIVRHGTGNAKDLAGQICANVNVESVNQPDADRFWSGLYPCGEVRSFDFSAAFMKIAGNPAIRVVDWEVYRIEQLDPGETALRTAVTGSQPLLIPLYSTASATHFFELLARYGLGEAISGVRFVAISAQCLDGFPPQFAKTASIAHLPNEEGMVLAATQLHNQIN